MKKMALFVALAMIAASPALAAQKKKKPAEPAMTKEQQQNDASWRLVRDSLPVWLPSWAQPVYQYGYQPAAAAADTKPAKKKKAKAKTS